MSFILSKEEFYKKLPQKIKPKLSFVLKLSDAFFASDKPLKQKNIYSIKCSEDNIKIIQKKLPGIKTSGEKNDILIENYHFRFLKSGKRSARKGDAKSTRLQELCSLAVCKGVFTGKPVTLSDLVKIYPDLAEDKSWQITFQAQEKVFEKIKKKFPQFKSNLIFNRDKGFMSDISKKVKQLGVRQKDSWNPADIWIHTPGVFNELKDIDNLYKLNHRMIELFDEGKLMGISLKKTGKVAKYELTNFKQTIKKNLGYIKGNLFLNTKPNGEFVNDELNYDMNHPDGTINVQVRMFPKKARSNVQVSYKLKGAKAEMGKVPSAFRNIVYKKITNTDFPQGKEMPTNIEQYDKKIPDYRLKINKIISSPYINTNINSFEEFNNSVKNMFDKKDYSQIELNAKFQCIEIAFQFSKLPKKKLDELVTDWAYLAQKKGVEFGPFIKVF